jgi:hypothetical protein
MPAGPPVHACAPVQRPWPLRACPSDCTCAAWGCSPGRRCASGSAKHRARSQPPVRLKQAPAHGVAVFKVQPRYLCNSCNPAQGFI